MLVFLRDSIRKITAVASVVLCLYSVTAQLVHAADNATGLSVLYAGSMTKVVEDKLKPDLQRRFGLQINGEGAGSSALAQMIKSGLKQPDIFISASPSVNQRLLMGPQNGNLERWFLTLAKDQLVIAYSSHSRFASGLNLSHAGNAKWYQVIGTRGFLLGRTDPKLDPKGINTLFMMKLAEKYYHQPGLEAKLLGGDENPMQVFPEETLLARLSTGQLDAVVAYKHEAVEWNMPYISLPDAVNLGDVKSANWYHSVSVNVGGKAQSGAPIVFTIAIPSTATHLAAATKFVQYMLRGAGHSLLLRDGFLSMPVLAGGSRAEIPPTLRTLIQGTWSAEGKTDK